MGQLKYNTACPQCSKSGEGRSLSVYDDGEYCNECGYTSNNTSHSSPAPTTFFSSMIPVGEYREIPKRYLSREACKKYRYSVSEEGGKVCRVASFYVKGGVVAQKLKFAPEPGEVKSRYKWLGNKSLVKPLFGMDLFEPNPKLSITVTEGEDDCVCLAGLDDCRWPVVSLLNGAGPQTKKEIAAAKEYLTQFRKIILMFDGDEAGRKAAEECAQLLGPKAHIAQMPDGEDVCSIVQKNPSSASRILNDLAIRAVAYRPKDIVKITDYTEQELYEQEEKGIDLPFPKLNHLLRGLKASRLYLFCAGSGLGKSTVVKELAYDLMFNQKKNVGIVFLEQDDREAMKDFIAMHNSVEGEEFCENKNIITKEKRKEAEQVLADRAVFFKCFGSLDTDKLVSKIEYMMEGCDCEFVFLDHISMAVSGQTSGEGERKDIDVLMTRLRTLVQKTGKSILAVSHLKRPSGDSKSYNEGAKVHLSALRGSASLEQISDFVIALERDQFHEVESDILSLKVLKSRRGGSIGYADELQYDHKTGRLQVI